MTILRGKCSHFGGPNDMGVSPDEGLAFIYDVEDAPWLFLPEQPPGTTGLARRLDADGVFYIACRWNYDETPKAMLPDMLVKVGAPKTGKAFRAYPADWGPHVDTGRVADLSPGLMEALGITTDDEVVVEYEPLVEAAVAYNSVVISSGHSKYVRGASGYLDEVDEARKVVDCVVTTLNGMGVKAIGFHDDISTTQNENLHRIVDFHNSQKRELDVSIHFNAYEPTDKPRGTEVLYVTQDELAEEMSAAIAQAGGFTDRGGKYNSGLYFLNNTSKPAILIEVAFVDSQADADLYRSRFVAICDAIAATLAGTAAVA